MIVSENMDREHRRNLRITAELEYEESIEDACCTCGNVKVRGGLNMHGGGEWWQMNPGRATNLNRWTSLTSTDPNAPTQLPGHGTPTWDFDIEGGNCYTYEIDVVEAVHPDDDAAFRAADQPFDGFFIGFIYLSAAHTSGGARYNPMFDNNLVVGRDATRGGRGDAFRESSYESPIPGVGQRNTLTIITVRGFYLGRHECTKIFYAQ